MNMESSQPPEVTTAEVEATLARAMYLCIPHTRELDIFHQLLASFVFILR